MEQNSHYDGQNQKHDEGYKAILSDKSSFLHFLKKYIAESWTAHISADDIELIDKSFVTAEYKSIESDLIYKVRINGATAYFYILLELQSKVDFTMPFRLFRYIGELLNSEFKNTDKNERERKGYKLPAVVPIVLYNGDDNWTAARTFREYTENHEIFGDNIIDFHYLLFDLKRTDESKIISTKRLVDIILTLSKFRFESGDFVGVAERLVELASELTEEEVSSLHNWMIHTVCRGAMPPEVEEKFKQAIKQKGEGNTMKTALEIARDEVEEMGFEKGIKQGKIEIAVKLKNEGMDTDTIARITGLTVDDVLLKC